MTQEELVEIAKARAAECKANMYKSESRVWEILQKHNDVFGLEWQTQIPIIIPWELKTAFDCKAFYIADFLEPNSNIIIEVDGEQHNKHSDNLRDLILFQLGYNTYRIKSLDVWNHPKLNEFLCDTYDKAGIWYNRFTVYRI